MQVSPEWVSAISGGLGTLAVLVAGGFAYIRFVRGRVHHPDLSVVLKPTLAHLESSPALSLQLVLKNVGTLRLFVDPRRVQRVAVHGVDAAMWQDGQAHGDVLWSEGLIAEIDLMTEEGYKLKGFDLEPGETSEQSLLIPLGTSSQLAYRVSAFVEACPYRLLGQRSKHRLWKSHTILLSGEPSHG